jgi:hypothetical protein
MLGNWAIRGEEPLGLPWGLEPLHTPLPLPRRLVRILRLSYVKVTASLLPEVKRYGGNGRRG